MHQGLDTMQVSYGRVGRRPAWQDADDDADDTDPGRLDPDVVALLGLDPFAGDPDPVQKSARSPRGVFIQASGAAHKRHKGFRPNPKGRLKANRPRGSAMPGEIGPGQANVMQESSMQVMHAITQSKRRNPRPDWGFDPAANLPGNTQHPKPVGKPNIFVYKSNPEITRAIHDYHALLEHGKTPIVALQTIGQRWPWVLDTESPRSRQWWAAVRRADLPRPRQFEDIDTEIDVDNTEAPRKKGRAVFWREGPANLGQGIMAPTGSGGAGR